MSKLQKPIKVVSYIILITIIVKILGFLRVLFMAKVFGTGIEASAFEAAYRIPDLLFTSIGVALSTTFIPIFSEYIAKEKKEEAYNFASNVVNMLFIITIIISLLGIVFAPYIVKFIYWGFKGDIYFIAVDLVRIMFPIIIFIALSFTYVGVLQSLGNFNIPAAISLPSNIINILYLILFSSIWGIYGFAYAVLLGWLSQLLIQLPSLKKIGYIYKPVLSFKHEGLKRMLIMIIPIILGTSVQQINVLVNSTLASGLGNSAVSALGYANYIYIIIVGIFTYAVSAVIFPSLSKMFAVNDYNEFKNTINKATSSIIFILTPIMVGLIVLANPIIRVLLERGRFDYQSTLLTSSVLFFYAFGMIGFGIQEIFNKGFYAIQNTKTPMKIGVAGMLLNIALSLLFVKIVGLGGLALAASIASTFIALALVTSLSKHINSLFETKTLISIGKTFFCSITMGIIVYLIYNRFYISPDSSFSYILTGLVTSIVSGIISFIVLSILLKIHEADTIIKLVKNKLFKSSNESEV